MAASTSSSASMCSSRPNHSRFDVFLSFRGEDTRYSFTDHLYDALKRAGIRTFRDDDEIDRGQDLGPELVKSIKESRASVVVLSENYAKSRWCLDELLLILDQRKNFNHFVLPVFYHVDPSDVRNHRQSFAIEAKEGVEGSKWTVVNVNRWKSALTEVANLTGMVCSGSETEFIAKICNTIDYELDLKQISTTAHLTGVETRAEYINSWLKNEHSDTDVLAICGMGGSGKTTLAQYVYNSNKHNFESSSFIEEIGKHYKQPHGLLGLQKQLLKDILGNKKKRIFNVLEGTSKIEEALQIKKALVVLDDIDDQDEIDALLGTKAVHTQSKIIITARLLGIDAWFGSTSWRCSVHKLKLLNNHESLELLSCHAFGCKIPMEGFKDLAVELAQYCGGNPLALKVLGSSLFVSVEEPHNRNSIWRSRLNSLSSLKGDLDSNIQGVLRKSFDSLPHSSYRELFLHIAIFFVGQNEDYVMKILEHDWHAKAGMMTLINKCLLTVSPRKILKMHQLLQDMGRSIVRDESKDPAKRSRVWHDDESYRLLGKGDGSETIEGLALDMRKLKKGTKPLALKTVSLTKMENLKLLQLTDVKLTGSYNNFPELRWLCWHKCHLKRVPSGLLMSSLVAIDMRDGNLAKFEPPTVLNSLKILNLRGCVELVSIHNLCRLPNLENLILMDCTSLTHVCKTIESLKTLAQLNLKGCNKLWQSSRNKKYTNQLERLKALCIGVGIPEQPLLSLPHSLEILNLDYCDLADNNDVRVVFHAQSFFTMTLCGNLFEFLPNNIDLNWLRVLNLSSCPNLKSLPCLPSTLEELYTYWCTSLEKITFQSARFKLSKFGYEGCINLFEIQGLFKLAPIEKLDKADLGHMQWIKAYQHHTVDLVGDYITKGRNWRIQILYEYGISSTYLQGTKDQSMTSEYMTSSPFLSFCVPLCPEKLRIQGLNIVFLYRSSGENKNMWNFFVKVSNTTKGLTWIYNPGVYCKPRVDEDAVWLSYWPIGNVLDVDDEVHIEMIMEEGLIVSECGASLVYMDGDVKQENCENDLCGKEVIGGDLSEFEVTTGGYYLCRRDIFESKTSYWLKMWFGDTVHYEDSRGWRKTHQPLYLTAASLTEGKIKRNTLYKKIVLGVNFNSETEIHCIKRAVSRLVGVEAVSTDTKTGRLTVVGHVDPIKVATCVKKFKKMVQILSVIRNSDL